MAAVSRGFCTGVLHCVRTASELILNRDQEWGELVLYGSIPVVVAHARAAWARAGVR